MDEDIATKIRAAIDAILASCPEHNRTDEHEAVVTEVTAAVLAVIAGEDPPPVTDWLTTP